MLGDKYLGMDFGKIAFIVMKRYMKKDLLDALKCRHNVDTMM